MKGVVVKTADLLEKIQTNRQTHKKEYDQAVINYRKEVRKELKKRLDVVRSEDYDFKTFDPIVRLAKPEEYLEEYDQAIEMLRWEENEQIEISAEDFNRFVRDKWNWSNHFAASTRAYNAI